MLLPSVLGLALCFVCLAATTWAWFVVSVTSDSNTIQTASFGVAITVTPSSGSATDKGNNVYSLSAGTYTVTLTPTGNATKGFAVVTVAAAQPPISQMLMLASAGNEEQQQTTPPNTITAVGTYYTQQLFVDGVAQVATFTIQTSEAVTLTVKAYWGEKQADLTATEISANLTDSNEAQLINEEEDPANENQQEEEQENQQQEEENPSDENNPADDTNTGGEGENTSTDTPAEGEDGQQGDEPSTPTDGEGEQQGGETTGGDISDDTATGGESPTGTTTPAGGDVPTDPAIATTPTAQSEGDAPADPAPIE